jgi:hypothetical protein
MLAPSRRGDRLLRRLRLAAVDIRSGEKAKEILGQAGPRPLEARLDDLRDIARREGLDEREAVRGVGYEEIVRFAGAKTATGEDVARFLWRMCSGIAHGDLWTTLSVADRVELPGAPAGTAHMKITANVETLLVTTSCAMAITGLVWKLLDERSRSPYEG